MPCRCPGYRWPTTLGTEAVYVVSACPAWAGVNGSVETELFKIRFAMLHVALGQVFAIALAQPSRNS